MICPWDGCEYESSERGVKQHHKISHGESIAGVKVSCDFCGDEYRAAPNKLAERNDNIGHNFCSTDCDKLFRNEVGTVTEPCSTCGSDVTRVKSEFDERDDLYCSRICYAEDITGEGSPRWKENVTQERFTDAERNQIFKRDDYTCQDCGERGCAINAHHIEPIHDGGDIHDTENGITLCLSCHRDRHEEMGDSGAVALIEHRM